MNWDTQPLARGWVFGFSPHTCYTGLMPKKSKKSQQTRHSPFPWLPLVLIIIGISLMSFWVVHRYFYDQSIALSKALIASYTAESSSIPTPIHITIGNSVSLPVVESGRTKNGDWAISDTSANHVRESALPGTPGNIIIYAHNLDRLFGKIQWVQKGETIRVRTTDGQLYTYKVIATTTVYPSQTELLQPTKHEVLTLYTCTGLFDSQRFVVQAIPSTSALTR